jgi:biphenyl-2,3-diol 1,2-dioxygenase
VYFLFHYYPTPFFHCNPHHHTIASAQMPGMQKRLHHFMLQLQSLDDVGATYDLDDSTWQVQVHTASSIWGHQGSI